MSDGETLINKLEKGRAEFAYRCVKEVIDKSNSSESGQSDKKLKEYKSYTRKIPQMILSNGLGQTLAFVKAKAKKGNAYEWIYKQLTQYFEGSEVLNKNELIEWVISCDSKDYRYITQEILAFLNWLKRFAEGMIEDNDEENNRREG